MRVIARDYIRFGIRSTPRTWRLKLLAPEPNSMRRKLDKRRSRKLATLRWIESSRERMTDSPPHSLSPLTSRLQDSPIENIVT